MPDAVTQTKANEAFDRSTLRPGDILLLAIKDYDNPVDEFADFFSSAMAAFHAWQAGKPAEEILQVSFPMIQIAITIFDQDRFSHAAVVGYPEVGGGGATVVIEIGPAGMAVSDLDDYLAAHPNPVAAVRYTKDGKLLGDASLPSEPIMKVANELLAGGPIQYGYFNAFVLAMLCAWRHCDGMVLDTLREALVRYFGEKHRVVIEMFFSVCGKDLRALLIKLSHVAGDYLRNRKELVCSEMVATCFNDATNPVGGEAYDISFERRPEKTLFATDSANRFESIAEAEMAKALTALSEAVTSVTYAPDLREPGLFFTAVNEADEKPGWWGNNLYTPSDLSKSINSYPLGDWSRK